MNNFKNIFCDKRDLRLFYFNVTIYRYLKKFSEECFNEELSLRLKKECVGNYSSIEDIFLDTLNWHAPIVPNVTKTLRQAIMRRSDLQIKFLKLVNLNH